MIHKRTVTHHFDLDEPIVSERPREKFTIEAVIVRFHDNGHQSVEYKGRLLKQDGSKRSYAAYKTVYPLNREELDAKWIDTAYIFEYPEDE